VAFAITLFAIATIAFFLLRVAPGGPFDTDRAISRSVRAALDRKYGLDRPLHEQYFRWVGDLVLRGDLGPSSQYPGMTVNDVLAESLPPSLLLGGVALALALVLGIPAGAFAGARRGRKTDVAVSTASILLVSVPNFVLGAVLLAFLALRLRILPAGGWASPGAVVLPALTLGLPVAAIVARLTREGVAEAMRADFVRTARAKGVPERRIVLVHALRVSLLPVVSYLGPAAAGVLTGSVVVEQIFAVPGLGTHFVNGALNRDYALILGVVLVYAALLVALNLLADLVLGWLDPRIGRES
jgi:oligopeptide transport system permease protein